MTAAARITQADMERAIKVGRAYQSRVILRLAAGEIEFIPGIPAMIPEPDEPLSAEDV